MKQPQMFQLGNLGMAMSHHIETRTTLAFIHGWDIFVHESHVTGERVMPHKTAIYETLKLSGRLLGHPLLLPAIFLRVHLKKAEITRKQLSAATEEIEKTLGVTKTARLAMRTVQDVQVNSKMNRMITDEKTRIHTTALLSTTVTDVINMKGTLEWDMEYVKFLRNVNETIKPDHDDMEVSSEVDLELNGFIDLLEVDAQSISSYATMMQSRLDIQLNVAGNNLNMKIAKTAGLDSTAMKTMAVVTMVFLPPTFVATIFSMSMFNWQASSSSNTADGSGGGSEPTVVPQFWIYWAVSLPLTVAIVIGWRVWWHFQKSYYETKFLSTEKEDKDARSAKESRRRV
ncbi:hypothetical protein CORC01_02247 [Colletotrichum orchidophilum]|uniref:CorA-like Mg2+ transporter n=1 Tax=Colletotrichum orchidophilum TaxID=1209926 RepID=A0A1G4BM65_9PEZI|nr:uncharacterized protein CORC01_02247 [Colletotrichum orchidophilum]OHF02552.1 hypothetical protein CORC01_02247 [Colletotrichum orchidophilum]